MLERIASFATVWATELHTRLTQKNLNKYQTQYTNNISNDVTYGLFYVLSDYHMQVYI